MTSALNALGPICAFLSSVTWALGSTQYSRLTGKYSAFAVNFARGLVALPLFFLTAVWMAHAARGDWGQALSGFAAVRMSHVGWFALSMVSSYALGDALFLWSTKWLGVPVALTIASSYPLLTAGWGLSHGEALTISQIAGLLITVGGVAAVILSGRAEGAGEKSERRIRRGVLLAFGASLLWALNNYSVARASRDLSTPVGSTIRMGLALVLCTFMAKTVDRGAKVLLPAIEYRRWLWLFAFEGFCGSYFFMYGLAHSSLAIASTLTALAPVISVPFALALGMERFSWTRTLSVTSVVAGLWMLVGGLN